MLKKQLNVKGHWKEGSHDCEQAQGVELRIFKKAVFEMTSEGLKGTMQTNGCVELKRKGQCLKQKECVVGPAFLERRALGKARQPDQILEFMISDLTFR